MKYKHITTTQYQRAPQSFRNLWFSLPDRPSGAPAGGATAFGARPPRLLVESALKGSGLKKRTGNRHTRRRHLLLIMSGGLVWTARVRRPPARAARACARRPPAPRARRPPARPHARRPPAIARSACEARARRPPSSSKERAAAVDHPSFTPRPGGPFSVIPPSTQQRKAPKCRDSAHSMC